MNGVTVPIMQKQIVSEEKRSMTLTRIGIIPFKLCRFIWNQITFIIFSSSGLCILDLILLVASFVVMDRIPVNYDISAKLSSK